MKTLYFEEGKSYEALSGLFKMKVEKRTPHYVYIRIDGRPGIYRKKVHCPNSIEYIDFKTFDVTAYYDEIFTF